MVPRYSTAVPGFCLLLALLTGCVASKSSKPAEEPNPFALPAGAPRNARVGFIQGYPLRSTSVPLLLCASRSSAATGTVRLNALAGATERAGWGCSK